MDFVKQESSQREALLNLFEAVRKKTEELCLPLIHEDYLLSVTEDTSPPKWHLAHTSWFFEQFVLRPITPNFVPYQKEFNYIFNSYYKRLGLYLEKNKRNVLSRPSCKEIFDYRNYVTKEIFEKVLRLSDEVFKDISSALELGINHEQQHQELLLMDIKRNFYENPLRPKYKPDHSHGAYGS